jgi:hypothetical protein
MLLRNKEGKLIEIVRSEYITDKAYYSKLLSLFKRDFQLEFESGKERIISLLDKNPCV